MQTRKNRVVAKYYGFGRRGIFSTEGSFVTILSVPELLLENDCKAPVTHNPQDAKESQNDPGLQKCSLKFPKISLIKGYFGQFKGYVLCSGNVGGLFASEGGTRNHYETPVCSQNVCSQFLCPLTPPSQTRR